MPFLHSHLFLMEFHEKYTFSHPRLNRILEQSRYHSNPSKHLSRRPQESSRAQKYIRFYLNPYNPGSGATQYTVSSILFITVVPVPLFHALLTWSSSRTYGYFASSLNSNRKISLERVMFYVVIDRIHSYILIMMESMCPWLHTMQFEWSSNYAHQKTLSSK